MVDVLDLVGRAVEDAAHRYLETYFAKRDLSGTLAFLSPLVSGFGTGADEVAISLDALSACYARDCAQAPNPITYILHDAHVRTFSPEGGVYSCRVDISTTVHNQRLQLNGLRLTLVLCLEDGAWRIAHMHISLPTTEHGGDESYPVKELEERNIVLQRLVDERTRQLNTALEEIRHLAVTDKLTGLSNRRMLDDMLSMEVERSRRYGNHFSVIMVDIDHFKRLNDTHGHAVGDDVLAAFAERVSSRLRKADTAGRWGGEEFVILCPETSVAHAREVAEAMRAEVAGKEFAGDLRLTASFGVASFKVEDSPETLIARADAALYAAKHQGRNRVCCAEK